MLSIKAKKAVFFPKESKSAGKKYEDKGWNRTCVPGTIKSNIYSKAEWGILE